MNFSYLGKCSNFFLNRINYGGLSFKTITTTTHVQLNWSNFVEKIKERAFNPNSNGQCYKAITARNYSHKVRLAVYFFK